MRDSKYKIENIIYSTVVFLPRYSYCVFLGRVTNHLASTLYIRPVSRNFKGLFCSACFHVFFQAAQLERMKEEETHEERNSDASTLTSSSLEPEEDFPDPSKQKSIVLNVNTESSHTYAVAKVWHRKWEEYVGIAKGCVSGQSEVPGQVEMDLHNDAHNDYVHEEIWKRFVRWYGVSPTHQLDRKHIYFKDEKQFDICMLSPFSGIVEHNVKRFNRFEENGYIECQLRRIFGVAEHQKSRLWISEKAQVPHFRQLLLRSRMLNDCIHRDKAYILALEECSGSSWPTGEPGEPKGELNTKYAGLFIGGPARESSWKEEFEKSLEELRTSIADQVILAAESFSRNEQSIIRDQERRLAEKTRLVETKLGELKLLEAALKDRQAEMTAREAELDETREQLEAEKLDLDNAVRRFEEEHTRMQELHQMQDSKVKVDVGGHIYSTSVQTLKRDPDSMLAAMFSGIHELKQEQDGSYFIDRDGDLFRYILNFLRDGHVDVETLPRDRSAVKSLLREAKYFKVGKLVDQLQRLWQEWTVKENETVVDK